MRTFLNYYTVWKQFGGLPEFYNIPQGYTVDKREGYPLRPGKQGWNKKQHESFCGCGVSSSVSNTSPTRSSSPVLL